MLHVNNHGQDTYDKFTNLIEGGLYEQDVAAIFFWNFQTLLPKFSLQVDDRGLVFIPCIAEIFLKLFNFLRSLALDLSTDCK